MGIIVEKVNLVFNIMIGVGIAIPIINILLGGLGTIFGIDFDFDGDTNFDCILPFNFICLMFGIAVFGIIGKLALNYLGISLAITIGMFIGIIAYRFALKHVVIPLKTNDASASKMSDLVGNTGTVVVPIPTSGFGEISLKNKIGSQVTYFASSKFENDEEKHIIQKDSSVEIVAIDNQRNNTFIVRQL